MEVDPRMYATPPCSSPTHVIVYLGTLEAYRKVTIDQGIQIFHQLHQARAMTQEQLDQTLADLSGGRQVTRQTTSFTPITEH